MNDPTPTTPDPTEGGDAIAEQLRSRLAALTRETGEVLEALHERQVAERLHRDRPLEPAVEPEDELPRWPADPVLALHAERLRAQQYRASVELVRQRVTDAITNLHRSRMFGDDDTDWHARAVRTLVYADDTLQRLEAFHSGDVSVALHKMKRRGVEPDLRWDDQAVELPPERPRPADWQHAT